MAEKRCSGCSELKPETEFFWRSRSRGVRHGRCKDCYRAYHKAYHAAHYAEHRHEYIARASKRSRRVRADYRHRLIAYLHEHPCVDCGEADIVVLEFHHLNRDKKVKTVSRLLGLCVSWDVIVAEIAKCIVLCANCHKRRTAREGGWVKLLVAGEVV